jgi:SanA protein
MRRVAIGLVMLLLAAAIAPWLWRAWVHSKVQARVHDQVESVPPTGVALVLGAGLRADGSPATALADRVATASELYRAGKVKKLLLSGDNRFVWYNEPEAMRQRAMQLGVLPEDIVLDYAGRRTYDSCYRAKEIFQVDQLVVVTQRFHLDRALYLCDGLGISAVGLVADRHTYASPYRQWWQLRELAALVKAGLDIHLVHPQPVLGDELPIQEPE